MTDLYTTAFVAIGVALLIWLIWIGVISGLAKTLEETFRRL